MTASSVRAQGAPFELLLKTKATFSKSTHTLPFQSAGATQRPSRPLCCRPRTACNSRRRLRQAAVASSPCCTTKACASPTSPSRRSSRSPKPAPGSRRAPARWSRLRSRCKSTAPHRMSMDMVPLTLDCTCASPVSFPTPHNGQESLSDNVTAVIFPMHQPFAAPALASFADGDGRCALAPVLTLPASPSYIYTLS